MQRTDCEAMGCCFSKSQTWKCVEARLMNLLSDLVGCNATRFVIDPSNWIRSSLIISKLRLFSCAEHKYLSTLCITGRILDSVYWIPTVAFGCSISLALLESVV